MEIAGLANLDKGEQNNVFCNSVLEPKDKAKKILTMINEEPTFSRKKLYYSRSLLYGIGIMRKMSITWS